MMETRQTRNQQTGAAVQPPQLFVAASHPAMPPLPPVYVGRGALPPARKGAQARSSIRRQVRAAAVRLQRREPEPGCGSELARARRNATCYGSRAKARQPCYRGVRRYTGAMRSEG